MTALVDVMQAVAAQLEAEIAPYVDGVQVDPKMIVSPTPPALDLYPGDPFGETIAFDRDAREQLLTIRARVSTADSEAGQDVLLALMDTGTGSVIAAIDADATLGGTVEDSVVEGPSGYIAYADAAGAATGSLLGCEWRLRLLR